MIPAVEVAGARVFLGDCVEVMKSLPDNSVDSIVTDPPYGLEFMGKDWDAPWKGKASREFNEIKEGTLGGFTSLPNHSRVNNVKCAECDRWRFSSNPCKCDNPKFPNARGQAMFAFQLWATEWAVECLRVLKPGGHILAFGGSRTWHRLAVAVEDAGFELRDSIAWLYGSGFPKSLDVSKAIDKRAGAEREVIGQHTAPAKSIYSQGKNELSQNVEITASATSEAKAWEGWGTALKPAFEPVVVGRKPLVGTVAENVLEWGVGGLNIDGSRIAGSYPAVPAKPNSGRSNGIMGEPTEHPGTVPHAQGRWPANVILDEVTAGLLDEQSGVSSSGKMRVEKRERNKGWVNSSPGPGVIAVDNYGDSGGASRFFYVAKASKRDRNEGLEELQATSAGDMVDREEGSAGMNSPRAGAGRTSGAKNFHPTVKPTQLMRYLIKLVTPPGGTVLDPFTGSGSTGKAALLDGFQFVGAELTEEYLPIIEGRLRWASEQVEDEDVTLF